MTPIMTPAISLTEANDHESSGIQAVFSAHKPLSEIKICTNRYGFCLGGSANAELMEEDAISHFRIT